VITGLIPEYRKFQFMVPKLHQSVPKVHQHGAKTSLAGGQKFTSICRRRFEDVVEDAFEDV
jgi:hypothetical protein